MTTSSLLVVKPVATSSLLVVKPVATSSLLVVKPVTTSSLLVVKPNSYFLSKLEELELTEIFTKLLSVESCKVYCSIQDSRLRL